MIGLRRRPADCAVPTGQGRCLPECSEAGACRAAVLRFVDGRTLVGRPVGRLGTTLRFLAVYPSSGPVLVPFDEAEPVSLHASLRACTDPGDGPALLALAEVCAERGLVDLALRELERAAAAAPSMVPVVLERRAAFREEAARRGLFDAREHLEAHRPDHARAALEEVLERFPDTAVAKEARALRTRLAEGLPA
jgi:hypothetical protein